MSASVKVQGEFRFEQAGDGWRIKKRGQLVGCAERNRYGSWEFRRITGNMTEVIGTSPHLIKTAIRKF